MKSIAKNNFAPPEPIDSPSHITIPHSKCPINATVDPINKLATLDYPEKMLGTLSLVKYRGFDGEKKPFSIEHCKKVAWRVEHGLYDRVRTSYNSDIGFEIPPFLLMGFQSDVLQAAIEAGIHGYAFFISNPINFRKSYVVFELSNKSLTIQIGPINGLRAFQFGGKWSSNK